MSRVPEAPTGAKHDRAAVDVQLIEVELADGLVITQFASPKSSEAIAFLHAST